MASINVDFSKYAEMMEYVNKAKLKVTEAIDDVWCTNFSNLYYNFITNNFLNDLYEDAESNYRLIFGGATGLICGAGAAIAGTAAATGATTLTIASVSVCIPVVGWIIGAIILGILAIIGIVYVVQHAADIAFKYDARDAFIRLLESCYNETEPNFLALLDEELKLDNAMFGLQTILFKIDEYQKKYANLDAALAQFNLKGQVAGDGTTLTGIETTVTVNGQTVNTTVSDAMNAFYTYLEVGMSTEIEADYIERTYGIEVDYNQVIANAGDFAVSTLQSGLYSHEFVEGLLPGYVAANPNILDEAKEKAAETAGFSTDDFSSILAGVSGLGGASAAIAALLGRTQYTPPTTPPVDAVSPPDEISPSPSSPTDDVTPPTGDPTGPGSGTPTGPGAGTPPTDDPTDTPSDTPSVTPETPTDTPSVTAPEFEEIVDVTLPEGDFVSEFDKDYDELAREWYEEMSADELATRRMNIINFVNQQFDNNDLEGIRASLIKFGYEDSYIDTILGDRQLLIDAMVVGDTNFLIAEKAMALAKADGVESFDSKFDDPAKYSDLADGSAKDILVNVQDSKEVTTAKTEMREAETAYNDKLTETNEALKTVRDNKTAMEDVQAKYNKEFGEDTTKWSEEAVNEYNDAIKKFNESVETYNTKNQELATAKDTYAEKITTFKETRDNYIKSVRESSQTGGDTTGGSNIDGSSVGFVGDPLSGTSDSGGSDSGQNDGISLPSGGSTTDGSSVGTSDDDALSMLG